MARRRRVSNLLALAVLSTLMERPMHPYEMASVMRERGKDQDMTIKWGSLYTVVRNLDKHGLLAVVENERQGGRPARTVYRITDAGRAELADWIRELVAEPEPELPRFRAGLSVLGGVGPEEALALLRQRLSTLEERLAEDRKTLAELTTGLPRIFLLEVEYDLAIRDAEATWVRSLIEEMAAGTLPGLREWRAFYATGEIPPEFAELLGRGGDEPNDNPSEVR